MDTIKRLVAARGAERGGEMNRQSREDFYGRENTLYDIIMMNIYIAIHLSKPIKYRTSIVKPQVNFGLWTIMMG